MYSKQDAVKLMVNMRGLKMGGSDLGLRLYWPVELQYCERARLNYLVKTQIHQLNREYKECFYDNGIEIKYVLISRLYITDSVF